MSEGEPQHESTYEAIPIRPWPRAMLALLGLGAAGAGGVAVFTEDLEAGPVALIAFGSLFLLLSILGYVPRKAEMAGAKVDFGEIRAVQRFVAETVENATPEQRPLVEEQVRELAVDAPQIAAPVLSAIEYENLVRAVLASLIHNIEGLTLDATVNMDYGQVDTVIRRQDGKKIAVNIKYFARPDTLQTPVRYMAIVARMIANILRPGPNDFIGYLYVSNRVRPADRDHVLRFVDESINPDRVQLVPLTPGGSALALNDALMTLANVQDVGAPTT